MSAPARILLGLAVVALSGSGVQADVAATGSFTVGLAGFPVPPNIPFEGDITFDDLAAAPLGTSVNLGTSVGQMTFAGSAAVSDEPPSATFTLTADDPNSAFGFTASGGGACDNPDCVGGTATFAGRFVTAIPPGFLPDAVITFDGTAALAFPTSPGGIFGLNAFASFLTAEGSDVTVSSGPTTYFDSRTQTTRTFVAEATFAAVSAGGETTFVGLSSVPGAPPAGVTISPPLSVFVDVVTSATVSGPIRVCIAYTDANGDGIEDGSGVAVSALRLLHALPPTFVDVTTSAGDGLVCGTVTALSPFVVGAGEAGSTTSTTVSGGGATTTTLPLGGCEQPVACIEAALGEPLCAGEQINPKLQAIITAKLGKAKALLQKAGTVATKKVAKLIAKARKQLAKVGTKADAFVSKRKGPITPGCRDGIRAALDQIGLALTTNPPTGTGTPSGSGVQATIVGRPAFQGVGFYYDGFPIYAEGCERFPGSQECRRLVTFSIENQPIGTAQTIVQPEAVVPFITYSEYPIASPSVSADIVLSSTAGTVIVIDGLVNGRLQGRFSGTFAETHPGGGPSVDIEGTFNVPRRDPPF
jgi:hypothetical protein